MFERTDVSPEDRLSSFCWMLDILQPLAGESKRRAARRVSRHLLRPASKSQSEASVGLNLTHDSSDKRLRERE